MTLHRIDRYLTAVTDLPRRVYTAGWRALWLTEKQATIFADRGLPKPQNRGDAADLIAVIAEKEGWE